MERKYRDSWHWGHHGEIKPMKDMKKMSVGELMEGIQVARDSNSNIKALFDCGDGITEELTDNKYLIEKIHKEIEKRLGGSE